MQASSLPRSLKPMPRNVVLSTTSGSASASSRTVAGSTPTLVVRRGRWRAATDLITTVRLRAGSMATLAVRSAWAIRASTSGELMSCGVVSTICRTRVPLPLSSLCGSARRAPFCRKNRLTQRG